MRAITYDRYGLPDVLRLTEVPKPIPSDDQILIEIRAVSINGSDREALVGRPLYARMGGPFKPGNKVLGSDIAGRVEAVGKNVTDFAVGDDVFGELPGYHGGFAEFACTSGKTMAHKPPGLTFEQAAAIPQGGVIAFNGIVKKGQVKEGQHVLINGAGGSAGSFAIQLAKLAGAEVTGVDSAEKVDFMRSLGANHAVDHAVHDFTTDGELYDLILDLVAHRSVFALRRALRPNGTYFFVGGSVEVMLQILLFGRAGKGSKDVRMLMVPQNRQDLIAITDLCVFGQVSPAIDRLFLFEEIPEAMRYVVEGHAKGKVVVSVSH